MDLNWIKIIDTLASEYGWSIEYIQDLDMSEIKELVQCINTRKITELQVLCYIVNCAIAGKKPKLDLEEKQETASVNEKRYSHRSGGR